MATMKKFRVVLDITINSDQTGDPDTWIAEYITMDEEGEKVEFVKQTVTEEWEEGDEDEDDEPSCPYSDGDRIHVFASTSTLEDHLGIGAIEASRIAGHKGRVIDTDPGDDYDVNIELDNGETTWINSEHLSMLVEEVKEG